MGRAADHPRASVRAPELAAAHGTAAPRGLDVDGGVDAGHGRFGRMFPRLPACPLGDTTIDAVAEWMGDRTNTGGDNVGIPAGFTYLGQFIDHDITFDPTPLGGRLDDPLAVENFRTPRLDLDSVYGAGPVVDPFLYDWCSSPGGVKLLVGHNPWDGTTDLPRNQQGRALIGDARNDEHVIISQLHLLFIRFHNAVVDHLSAHELQDDAMLAEAQRLVRWHYQWIVVHEFLPKIVGDEIAGRVFTPATGTSPAAARLECFRWRGEPFIPREFSGAAYRFGHSMVRRGYGVKRVLPGATVRDIPIFPDLRGFRPLHARLAIDWERFFKLERALPGVPRQVQDSMKIDTSIVGPLFTLPDGQPDLPRRNLLRSRELKLPSGQCVAHELGEPLLSDAELQLDAFERNECVQDALRRAAPLWYYILCEAARGGGKRLGPVGGRIVAEVLVGLLVGDPNSFLSRNPSWRPRAASIGDTGADRRDEDFKMADLVRFVERARD